jgi:predicted nuclease of predicted toxin-antitoxin system
MKFLVDNPLSKAFAQKLSEAGLDVVHVRDLGLHKAPDEKIFDLAQKENRIIISADTDFGTILALRKHCSPSVVIFRCVRNRQPLKQAVLFLNLLPKISEDLEKGSVVVIEDARIRIRNLPII